MKVLAMRTSPLLTFAAGFVAGGIALGAIAAHARIFLLNSANAGVYPNSEGSLFCTSTSGQVLSIRGVSRETNVTAANGGISYGVTFRCPAN
jgi:hypothetical protein